jgi:uncharacterized protein YceH (UPF0502 family)
MEDEPGSSFRGRGTRNGYVVSDSNETEIIGDLEMKVAALEDRIKILEMRLHEVLQAQRYA